jgi:hypothetical protein
MTDIITANDIEVEINTSAVEPAQYFKILKGKTQDATSERLSDQLKTVSAQIIAANRVGQKSFLEKLAFTHSVIVKEQMLLANGISKFVYKDDIKQFLDKVQPVNSIKIIELERYPRAIPLDVLNKLDAVKQLGIFDEFCVVFTDLTDSTYETADEKEFVKRNRDPIVFGFFKEEKTSLKHDRFYFVVDWEDEHCDLTFTKMIEKMAELDMKNVEKEIGVDPAYLQEIVDNTLASMGKRHMSSLQQSEGSVEKPKSWFKRIFGK